METQPQLLLLQKTMVVAEGVGRTLNPDVNMWELPRPMIEDWMLQHRGPQARIKEAASHAITLAERLPQIIEATDKVMGSMTEGGVVCLLRRQAAPGNRGPVRRGKRKTPPLLLAGLARPLHRRAGAADRLRGAGRSPSATFRRSFIAGNRRFGHRLVRFRSKYDRKFRLSCPTFMGRNRPARNPFR